MEGELLGIMSLLPIIFHSGGLLSRRSTSSILSISRLKDGSDRANSLPIPAENDGCQLVLLFRYTMMLIKTAIAPA